MAEYDPDTVRRQEGGCYGPCTCHCTACDWAEPQDEEGADVVSCIMCGGQYCGDCWEDNGGCIVNDCRRHWEEVEEERAGAAENRTNDQNA